MSDRLSRDGAFASKADGPEAGFLCRKHNELYKTRTTELKFQRKECYLQGILLRRHGVKVVEWHNRLQERLGNFGEGKAVPVGALERRRAIKNKTNRESPVDSAVTEWPDGTSQCAPPRPRLRKRLLSIMFRRLKDLVGEIQIYRHPHHRIPCRRWMIRLRPADRLIEGIRNL